MIAWIAKIVLLAVLALGGCWLIVEADNSPRGRWFLVLGVILLGAFGVLLWRFSE